MVMSGSALPFAAKPFTKAGFAHKTAAAFVPPQWMINEKRAALFEDPPALTLTRQMISLCHEFCHNPKRAIRHLAARHPNPADHRADEYEADLPLPQQGDEEGYCGPMDAMISAHILHCAYQRGLRPDHLNMRAIWSSPPQRVLYQPQAHLAPAVAQVRSKPKAKPFCVSFHDDFEAVLHHCTDGSVFDHSHLWLSREIKHHLATLFDLGQVHCWLLHQAKHKWCAGGMGVVVGKLFIIEALFGDPQARAIGLAQAHDYLLSHGIEYIDASRISHLINVPVNILSRAQFLAALPHLRGYEAHGQH
jgi:Leu/Phe-tRNA-protein transferase